MKKIRAIVKRYQFFITTTTIAISLYLFGKLLNDNNSIGVVYSLGAIIFTVGFAQVISKAIVETVSNMIQIYKDNKGIKRKDDSGGD